jgi:hypothetical protein
MDAALREQLREDHEVDRQARAEDEFHERTGYEKLETAAIFVPQHRQLMVIRDRTKWDHYYTMPSNIGMQQVPWLVQSFLDEGVSLDNIQIEFQTQEIKR